MRTAREVIEGLIPPKPKKNPCNYVVHDREWSMATTKPVLQSLESAAVHL